MTIANNTPSKVLISGGHEIGGVESFAVALRDGFNALGIPAEVISPSSVFKRWKELRDVRVLKILSTSALFAAPFVRRAICIAHCVPCAPYQGWTRLIGIIGSFKLVNCCSYVQLVAVSDYTAAHLQALFDVKVDAVILNPLKPIYLEPRASAGVERQYITYLGRLVPIKTLDRLLPIIRVLMNEAPALRMCIIGDGPQREFLEKLVEHDSRFEFKGNIDDNAARDCLRRSKVFVSTNRVEALGITYLEALSQGCVVAMPACGGGLEIALDQIGSNIHLLPLSFNQSETLAVLRRALASSAAPIPMNAYSAEAVATAYLKVDARFSPEGKYEKVCTQLEYEFDN